MTHELTKGLYQCGLGELQDLANKVRPDIIVSLNQRDEFWPADRIPTAPMNIAWPINDRDELPDTDMLFDLVEFLAQQIQSHKKVIIHCAAGLNRSGLLAAEVFKILLLFHGEFKTGREVIAMMRDKRGEPLVLCNPTFAAFVSRNDPVPFLEIVK